MEIKSAVILIDEYADSKLKAFTESVDEVASLQIITTKPRGLFAGLKSYIIVYGHKWEELDTRTVEPKIQPYEAGALSEKSNFI